MREGTVFAAATASNYDTDRIWRDDQRHFVHPFTHFDSFKQEGSLVITGAKGAHITDSRGKRYLDGIGGLWCMSLGFGEEETADLDAVAFHSFPAFPSVRDACRVANIENCL